jgi:hypothetical protein
MRYKQIKGNEIEGELDIFISQHENEHNGEVSIHGDPKGLRSLGELLIEMAELDQEKVNDKYLPIGAREHYHLRPGIELSKSSMEVIVGRLDAKGTGNFYERYIPKER